MASCFSCGALNMRIGEWVTPMMCPRSPERAASYASVCYTGRFELDMTHHFWNWVATKPIPLTAWCVSCCVMTNLLNSHDRQSVVHVHYAPPQNVSTFYRIHVFTKRVSVSKSRRSKVTHLSRPSLSTAYA